MKDTVIRPGDTVQVTLFHPRSFVVFETYPAVVVDWRPSGLLRIKRISNDVIRCVSANNVKKIADKPIKQSDAEQS